MNIRLIDDNKFIKFTFMNKNLASQPKQACIFN